MKWWLMGAGCVLAAGLAGCGDKAGPGGEKPRAEAPKGETVPRREAPKDIPVELAEVTTVAALDAALKDQKGYVVLVDFWASF